MFGGMPGWAQGNNRGGRVASYAAQDSIGRNSMEAQRRRDDTSQRLRSTRRFGSPEPDRWGIVAVARDDHRIYSGERLRLASSHLSCGRRRECPIGCSKALPN